MRRRYTVFLVVVLAAGIVSVTGYLLLKHMEHNLDTLSMVSVREIDLRQVPDGTYTGEKAVFPPSRHRERLREGSCDILNSSSKT